MSEPTNAEIAEQEDMRLDAQIDEYLEEKRASTTPDTFRVEIGEILYVEFDPPPILEEVDDAIPR